MTRRLIEYVPPSPDLLEHFARHACREWRPESYERQRALDFTNFIKAVSNALAKDLTRKANAEFDTRVE